MKAQPVIAFKYLPPTLEQALRLVWMAEVSRRVFAMPSWAVGVMYTVVVFLVLAIVVAILRAKHMRPTLTEEPPHA